MRKATTGEQARSALRWLGLALLVLALAGGLLMLAGRKAPAGVLTAEHQLHDFGQVPIDGGVIMAEFPLAVEGTVVVTGLGTT